MAIVHADNFNLYGAGGQAHLLDGVYADNGGCSIVVDPDGTDTGSVLRQVQTGSGDATSLRYALASGGVNTIGVAFRVWGESLPPNNANAYGVFFRSSANGYLFAVAVNADGSISVYGNNPAAPIATTAVPVVSAHGWWHIEVKFTIGAGAGACEVRVEGATVISITNQAFGATQIGMVCLGHPFGSGDFHAADYKDLVIWDTTGANNANFLGSVLVLALAPNADASLNWTPTPAGTGWSILDNIPPNDAQFITAPTPPPSPYVGQFADLPVDVTSVKALVTYVRAGKADGGDGSLQTGLISSPAAAPATVLGANRPITTSQTYWRDVFETDPKTGNAWLPAAVNNAEIQINRTA